MTTKSLLYLICDDDGFNKINPSINLCTESFSLNEVKLLPEVLVDKFKIKCTLNARGGVADL
jgi:LAGLIDADG DNA endonuclease family